MIIKKIYSAKNILMYLVYTVLTVILYGQAA